LEGLSEYEPLYIGRIPFYWIGSGVAIDIVRRRIKISDKNSLNSDYKLLL